MPGGFDGIASQSSGKVDLLHEGSTLTWLDPLATLMDFYLEKENIAAADIASLPNGYQAGHPAGKGVRPLSSYCTGHTLPDELKSSRLH